MEKINRFRELMKLLNYSNRKTAEYLGVNITTVTRWKSGAYQAPKMAYRALELLLVKQSID